MILLINMLMTMSLVSDSGSGVPQEGCPSMLRRLESQCTGGSDGASESEEVKVKGGKKEGG